MAYEIRDNTGSLFPNEYKKSESHPDKSGKAKIDGILYWVNSWDKESKDGTKYLSLSFKLIGDVQAGMPPNKPSEHDEADVFDVF